MAKSAPLFTDHGRSKPVTLCGTSYCMSTLAAATDYSTGYVSRVLRGERQPSERALKMFAKRLRVSPKDLATMIAEEKQR